ncbi:unnamed protein product, partial [Symbiodinium sp. KB8]
PSKHFFGCNTWDAAVRGWPTLPDAISPDSTLDTMHWASMVPGRFWQPGAGIGGTRCECHVFQMELKPPNLSAGGFDCLEKGLNDFECNGNHFGENACCCLAENMSKWIPTLRRLALSSTGVGLRACGALGQGLWPGAGLAGLKILDLSNNRLIDVSVELLCNGLSRCISLQEVELSHNAS